MLTNKIVLSKRLWLPCVVGIILSLVVLPIYLSVNPPLIRPLGVNVKNGDRIFYNFLDYVKKTDGVIIMGTSETGNTFDGNNYWGLLDRDEELNRRFYAFGGAGRCSYVYFPLIFDNPSAFENLEIIYYINPTYWRMSLNKFNPVYYKRYINQSIAYLSKYNGASDSLYKNYVEPGIDEVNSSPFYTDRLIENYKSIFYSDLNKYLSSASSSDSNSKRIIISKSGKADVLATNIRGFNLEFNATDEFLKSQSSFPSIDTNSVFQSNMLLEFIKLIEENSINCTFYLGPINEIYCREMNPDKLQAHLEVVKEIKRILRLKNAKFIDGSYQSVVPGTFLDVQHISEFGAYLTALDIKNYYEKNN